MRARRSHLFVMLVGCAGCLASKSDVALLQNQLQSMRDASTQSAAEQRAHIDRVLNEIARTTDSVRTVSQRLAKLQGDVQTDHYAMGRQILQLQELSGQSQRRLQELRAALEERNQTVASSSSGSDTSRAAPGMPGEAQLFTNAFDQLRRGSLVVARNGFLDLLRAYPASENAPEAMIYIAKTYADERNQVAADSVYGLVIRDYPKSPKAATALYKRALLMKAAGQTAAARTALQRVVNEYPQSDEAELAREQLRNIR